MKPDDRQLIFDRLMLGVKEKCEGDAHAFRIFEESTLEDLDIIEPVIDQIIEREVSLAKKEATP